MVNGILNIHKEKGFTSHDVVAKLRGIVGQRKIGHTGTLDPDATGVLPVCLGKATKLCDLLTDKNKTYQTTLLLGTTTDTQDTSGTVLAQLPWEPLDVNAVRDCIDGFVGHYDQIPPMYSALKVDGRKLYELAREGREVERKSRPVTIYEIKILEIDLPYVQMEVTCSKGTYIRTLCHDIGQALHCGGCMAELTRTQVERFTLADSITLAEVEKARKDGRLEQIIMPIDQMFDQYQKITVTDEALFRVYNGSTFRLEASQISCEDGERVRVYDNLNRFVALYQYRIEGENFKIVKMFFENQEMA